MQKYVRFAKREKIRKAPETLKVPGFSVVRPMRFERTTFRVGDYIPYMELS